VRQFLDSLLTVGTGSGAPALYRGAGTGTVE